MDLYEAWPASWILFVQWVREDPARAQEVGIRFIERILTVPGLAPELEAIIAGTAAVRLESEKAALAAKPAPKKPQAKREKAVFDPIDAALSGETVLREKLAELTRPQLSDMLFQYALDPTISCPAVARQVQSLILSSMFHSRDLEKAMDLGPEVLIPRLQEHQSEAGYQITERLTAVNFHPLYTWRSGLEKGGIEQQISPLSTALERALSLTIRISRLIEWN